MISKPDLSFNDKEIQFMYDPRIFPLKHQITQKLYLLFEQIKTALKDTPIHQQFPFPPLTDLHTGKITRGENYQLNPYVILDFPRLFSTENIFAFRTMFWFGHYFSFSLLVSGQFAHQYKDVLLRNRKLFAGESVYFSIYEDPWGHEVELPHQVLIEVLDEAQIADHIQSKNYFKLTCRTAETSGQKMVAHAQQKYRLLLMGLLGGPDLTDQFMNLRIP